MDVEDAVSNLSRELTKGTLLVQIILIAAITMAAIQLLKDFLPLRWLFQQTWMKFWITVRGQKFWLSRKTRSRSLTLRAALSQIAFRYFRLVTAILRRDKLSGAAWQSLVELAAGGRKRSLFRLPSEQLVAQINAAAQIVLQFPLKHQALLEVLSQGADRSDVKALLSYARDMQSPKTSQDSAEHPLVEAEDPKRQSLQQGYLDASTRVAHRIQRNLDAIHVAMAGDWKLFMQLLALACATVIAYLGLPAPTKSGGATASYWLLLIFVALTSGYLASVLRDIVAALQRTRES